MREEAGECALRAICSLVAQAENKETDRDKLFDNTLIAAQVGITEQVEEWRRRRIKPLEACQIIGIPQIYGHALKANEASNLTEAKWIGVSSMSGHKPT